MENNITNANLEDYKIAYKLNSVMGCINGSAIYDDDDGVERVYITIPVNRIVSLESYGIKNPQYFLADLCEDNGFTTFIDDDNKLEPLIVIGCDKLIAYKKLIKLLYDFCQYIVSQTDKITIELKDENEIIVHLPLLCLFRCVQSNNPKELNLILDIIESLICDEFGSESYESVSVDGRESHFSHIGKYQVTIDFVDRDKIFKDISDIETLSNIIHNASSTALDIIFEEYID